MDQKYQSKGGRNVCEQYASFISFFLTYFPKQFCSKKSLPPLTEILWPPLLNPPPLAGPTLRFCSGALCSAASSSPLWSMQVRVVFLSRDPDLFFGEESDFFFDLKTVIYSIFENKYKVRRNQIKAFILFLYIQ